LFGCPALAMNINAYLEITADGGEPFIRCRACGHDLGPAGESYKRYAAERRRPLSVVGVEYVAPERQDDPFELREYYCPSCAVLLDTDVARRSEPAIDDVELRVAADE
jgi:N-methylhydantoinase B